MTIAESKPLVNGYYKGLEKETLESKRLKDEVYESMKSILLTMSEASHEKMSYSLEEAVARYYDLFSIGRDKPHWLKTMAREAVTEHMKEVT